MLLLFYFFIFINFIHAKNIIFYLNNVNCKNNNFLNYIEYSNNHHLLPCNNLFNYLKLYHSKIICNYYNKKNYTCYPFFQKFDLFIVNYTIVENKKLFRDTEYNLFIEVDENNNLKFLFYFLSLFV